MCVYVRVCVCLWLLWIYIYTNMCVSLLINCFMKLFFYGLWYKWIQEVVCHKHWQQWADIVPGPGESLWANFLLSEFQQSLQSFHVISSFNWAGLWTGMTLATTPERTAHLWQNFAKVISLTVGRSFRKSVKYRPFPCGTCPHMPPSTPTITIPSHRAVCYNWQAFVNTLSLLKIHS